MPKNVIYISKKPECVEATFFPKNMILPWLQEYHGVTLEEIAAIGDTKADFPILERVGLPMTIANGKPEVKTLVRARKGFISEQETYEGSMDCYKEATRQGKEMVVFDRDGCIWKKGPIMIPWDDGEIPCGQDFASYLQESSYNGSPKIVVLTASSLTQNERFRIQYGLDERLRIHNPTRKRPKILLVENGAIHVDVLTGEATPYHADLNPEFVQKFLQEYKPALLRNIISVMSDFGITITHDYEGKQDGECYIDPKKQAFTANIPRNWTEKGIDNLRAHPTSCELREAFFDTFTDTAENTNMPYEEL